MYLNIKLNHKLIQNLKVCAKKILKNRRNKFLEFNNNIFFQKSLTLFKKKYFLSVDQESFDYDFLGRKINIYYYHTILENYARIFGITRRTILFFLRILGVTQQTLLKELDNDLIVDFQKLLEKNIIARSDDFLNFLNQQVFHLQKIENYRARRHFFGFPSRGQRTHSNAKTSKRMKLNVGKNL